MIALSKFRAAMGLPTERDGELRDLLDGVVGTWEDATKRLWTRRAGFVETFRFDVTKRIYTLFLNLWPLEAITKIEEKTVDATDWTQLDTDSFIVLDMTRNKVERIGRCWMPMVRVTYTGGYVPEPTVGQFKTPLEIQEVLILQARFAQERNVPGRLITQSQNFIGGSGVFLRPDLHPAFARMADQKARKV